MIYVKKNKTLKINGLLASQIPAEIILALTFLPKVMSHFLAAQVRP